MPQKTNILIFSGINFVATPTGTHARLKERKTPGYRKGRVEPAKLNRPPLLRRVSVVLKGELRSPNSDDQGLKDRFSKAAICTDVVFA
jgi:hypothetical protein